MKRRLRMLVLVLVLSAASFRVPASAVAGSNSAATRADFTATVDIDGNCLVTMQMSLHLDKEEENLYFPLPGTAANITINGSSPSTTRSSSYVMVSLNKVTGGKAGDFMVQLSYTLPKIVVLSEDRKNLVLTLPILSGFSYPVSTLNYTITLPDAIDTTPNFYSTYQQNGLASELNLLTNGNLITGSTKAGFNEIGRAHV